MICGSAVKTDTRRMTRGINVALLSTRVLDYLSD